MSSKCLLQFFWFSLKAFLSWKNKPWPQPKVRSPPMYHPNFFSMWFFLSIDVWEILIWSAPVHEYKFQPSVLTHASSRGKDMGYPRDPRQSDLWQLPSASDTFFCNQISGTHPLSVGQCYGGLQVITFCLVTLRRHTKYSLNTSTLCPFLFGWCELSWDIKSRQIFMKVLKS